MVEIKQISKEVLPDGRTVITYEKGGKFIYPQLPSGDWSERVAKELCEIQYAARRRRLDICATEDHVM